jgi:hypothetical protein
MDWVLAIRVQMKEMAGKSSGCEIKRQKTATTRGKPLSSTGADGPTAGLFRKILGSQNLRSLSIRKENHPIPFN